MAIEIVTKQGRAKAAIGEWTERYLNYGNPEKDEITRQLNALSNPEPGVVNAIIGNTSWTDIECNLCDSKIERGVFLSDATYDGGDTYDGRFMTVCADCLEKASSVLTTPQPDKPGE